ncbi:ArsR family transcriptional regulator [Desulfosediminicola flagellatus]|uniref:ArsR family transcriptional regulator n=1 Tax=Desulfosediminicola flagellatus TaxID=2569541 RepID=UPI00142EA457|nr:ArsR family transcriptional regulator [Desulfosediminicola flagellatus]
MSCGCGANTVSDEQKKILEALVKIDGPCGTKDVVEETGLDKKLVSAAITKMKKQGLCDSPARCKHGITDDGRSALKA